MSWHKIFDAPPPVGRPVLVRTAETDQRKIAFLGADGIWYEGGALRRVDIRGFPFGGKSDSRLAKGAPAWNDTD